MYGSLTISRTASPAAILVTPWNVIRYLGYAVMGTLVELAWRSQVRSGGLTAALTDHFAGNGALVVDIGASWGLFSYHRSRCWPVSGHHQEPRRAWLALLSLAGDPFLSVGGDSLKDSKRVSETCGIFSCARQGVGVAFFGIPVGDRLGYTEVDLLPIH
jgi:hypothetical protein